MREGEKIFKTFLLPWRERDEFDTIDGRFNESVVFDHRKETDAN